LYFFSFSFFLPPYFLSLHLFLSYFFHCPSSFLLSSFVLKQDLTM
jgi:hypothetical protein